MDCEGVMQQIGLRGVVAGMSEPKAKLYIPPYSGVRLIEYRDRIQLVPVSAVHTMYGYGKIKSSDARMDPDDCQSEPIWDDLAPDVEVWAVSRQTISPCGLTTRIIIGALFLE